MVTEEEIIRYVTDLPGAIAVTASAANGAPEAAWGDTFFANPAPKCDALARTLLLDAYTRARERHSVRK